MRIADIDIQKVYEDLYSKIQWKKKKQEVIMSVFIQYYIIFYHFYYLKKYNWSKMLI